MELVQRQSASRMDAVGERSPNHGISVGSALLGLGLAVSAVLGPFALGVIHYRTSDAMLNQVIGGDAAMLFVAAPVAIVSAIMLWRGHRAGPVLALAPAVFALYTLPQLIVGQEFGMPGNSEHFFPLQLAEFALAGFVLVAAWRAASGSNPALTGRLSRVAGWVLIGIATFLVIGLHMSGLLDALSAHPESAEYLVTPTAFWLVKFMDLGIIVPLAAATGVALLRRRPWADRLAFAMIGGYAVLASSVTGMAITMQVNNDPDASLANTLVFGVFSVAFFALAVALYLPLFRRERRPSETMPVTHETLRSVRVS